MKNHLLIFFTFVVSIFALIAAYTLGRNNGWSESARYFTGASECKLRRKDLK